VTADAARFDAIYRDRQRAGRAGWHDGPPAVPEVLGYLDELVRAARPPARTGGRPTSAWFPAVRNRGIRICSWP
jgi:hypothetical protein